MRCENMLISIVTFLKLYNLLSYVHWELAKLMSQIMWASNKAKLLFHQIVKIKWNKGLSMISTNWTGCGDTLNPTTHETEAEAGRSLQFLVYIVSSRSASVCVCVKVLMLSLHNNEYITAMIETPVWKQMRY